MVLPASALALRVFAGPGEAPPVPLPFFKLTLDLKRNKRSARFPVTRRFLRQIQVPLAAQCLYTHPKPFEAVCATVTETLWPPSRPAALGHRDSD